MFSWMRCFITNKKGADSSKLLNVFFHAVLLMRHDARWYFPGLCGVPETTIWHSRQASTNTFPPVSLFTKDDDSAKTVPVECFLDGHVVDLFLILPPPFLIGFTQEAIISLEAGFGLIMFPVLCLPFFTQYQSTLILVPTSMRTKWLQGLYLDTMFLRSKCWILPRPIHPMWNLGPQSLMIAGDVFLDALLYYQ